VIAGGSFASTGGIKFLSHEAFVSHEARSLSRLNEDNMIAHHQSHEVPPQEWTMFNGKVPVLQDAVKTDEEKEEWNQTYRDMPRMSVLMELTDKVGILHDVLRFFWKYDVNICRIESRPHKAGLGGERNFDFFVDFEGSPSEENVVKLLDALTPMTEKLLVLDEKHVHWFPRHISELDLIAGRTLDAGIDLQSDHPGFSDMTYRTRRALLTESAQRHRWDMPIRTIDYTPEETAVWGAVWDKMEGLWEEYACKEYLNSLALMKEHCGYTRDKIPQQQDISEFLQKRSDFRMRPVAGLLSSRDFLNGLAFRVFFSTQYIRHHSRPLYTPEPDICHELLGHAPMFADRDFADFSQEIGLASLGASDDDVLKLAHCYWHSVEFGLCKEDGKNKAYGAGLLSSFGELEYACSEEHPGADALPIIKPWDPEVAARQAFPITTMQPVYFLADTLQDAKQRMREYCEALQRPFFALHNPQTQTVHIDRPVKRVKGVPGEAQHE
jgi:phenylalanine-4-hydroxylase